MIRYISILLGLSLVLLANAALASTPNSLQIGEVWSRYFYNGRLTTNESLNGAIKATARLDLKNQRGTAFYVGKFLGQHIMVTNYHVMSDSRECSEGGKIYFQYLDKKYRCSRIISKFKNLELTFFSIRVSRQDEYLFEKLALKFDFVNEHGPGEKIVTAGYGLHQNNKYQLTYESSSTCVVATATDAPRFTQVRNDIGRFNAWSFVHACEISSGDSGSALVNEVSGKVIGVNWATSSNKPLSLRDSNNVLDWIERQNPKLWSSMSLGVPNAAILEAIQVNKNPTLMEFVRSNL